MGIREQASSNKTNAKAVSRRVGCNLPVIIIEWAVLYVFAESEDD